MAFPNDWDGEWFSFTNPFHGLFVLEVSKPQQPAWDQWDPWDSAGCWLDVTGVLVSPLIG